MRISALLVSAAVLGLAIVAAPVAEAGHLITATDGTTTATANDSTTPGFAQLNQAIGNFNINLVTGTGLPILTLPELLDVATLNISTVGSGTLTIKVVETGLPSITGLASFMTEFTGTFKKATVSRSVWVDPTNGGLESLLIGGTTFGNDLKIANNLLLSGPFSLTEEITITANGQGALVSLDDTTSLIPEPGTLAVLGLGLAATGLLRRRQQRG